MMMLLQGHHVNRGYLGTKNFTNAAVTLAFSIQDWIERDRGDILLPRMRSGFAEESR